MAWNRFDVPVRTKRYSPALNVCVVNIDFGRPSELWGQCPPWVFEGLLFLALSNILVLKCLRDMPALDWNGRAGIGVGHYDLISTCFQLS